MSKKSTNILFLVPYPLRHAPSQRFRVELYEPYLKEAATPYHIAPFMDEATWTVLYKGGSTFQKLSGIAKGYLKRWKTVLFDIHQYTHVFVHREAAPLGPPVFEWIASKLWDKKMIYDYDDAIWIPNTSNENRFVAWFKAFWKVKYICRWSYRIAGGNDYLCRYAAQYTDSSKVVRLPTCVDVEKMHNKTKTHHSGQVVIGWTGSHSTLFYLDELLPALLELEETTDFTFLVIANKDPQLPLKGYQFLPWNEATEIQDLLRMDIGVMPLQADEWSEGKCGFKLIQYLSLGIPAIASPVGVNKKIIVHGANGFLVNNKGDWKIYLERLIQDVNLRIQMGKAGREKIVDEYSIQSQKEQFLSLFS